MSDAPDLIYYPDDRPGIRRQRRGRGFSYLAPDGTRIADRTERKRITALAVPPAWEDVWICPLPAGHLQATGRDARTRKQYRYHPDWTAFRAARKYDHLADFGEALPRLRRRILSDLRDNDAGDRAFAIAAVLALIDRAGLRIGTQDYARENKTYGATTLRSRHLDLSGDRLRLRYRGKGGQMVTKTLKDQTLNRVLTRLDDLPGPELIGWIDEDGAARSVTSDQINGFLTDYLDNSALTAKTFRTWNGSVAALDAALAGDKPTIKSLSEAAAERLHNTPSIARSSYIHPKVIDLVDLSARERERLVGAAEDRTGLRRREAQLLHLLSMG
ncbi:DNA topoisomerase IB [Marivita sp. GX14005]|uniref:DNA topoisomerase IB n=1 Tax=Marivita sp. GX14005 TaxID=2942276 RepID=UPI00201919D2|nr:DNA topoisomerase IB [Marivita sp. GX14005]MCL3882034.1 DNA topoisomerase IB [Marivita sp. GX14005]